VKGAPALRRAHVDQVVAAARPARAGTRRAYTQVLAQRNALLRRVAGGLSPRIELDAWDEALAQAAVPLIEARASAVDELAPRFSGAAAGLGLESATIRYAPRAEADAEAVALALADDDPEHGGLTVRSGKGRQARTSYRTDGAQAAMAAWRATAATRRARCPCR
jgi:DNA replication and repair protein RecF